MGEEYPKWVNGWIVPDPETERDVLNGTAPIPVLPQSAQHGQHQPIMPSVKSTGLLPVPEPEKAPADKKSDKKSHT